MSYKGVKEVHTDTGNLGLGDLGSLMEKPHSYPPHHSPNHPTPRSSAYLLYTAEKEIGLLNTDKQGGNVFIYS